ncbi:hypothetical protein [Cytobacillus horneckiae]|uniref:hypothetical protein n=1 Tax=Cytobacillus horneckiae TaxID=549687 RepID=UPI003D1D75BF
MSRFEKYHTKPKNQFASMTLILILACAAVMIGIYIYAKSSIIIEAPKKDLGEKIIIELPSGKQVFTYENLIVQKDDKLIYKGERNTLDLTGGVIKYEDWD